jgi:hypothetical protein
MGRISTTFNAFSISPPGGLGLPDLTSLPQNPITSGALNTNQLRKCPGSNERPAPDGSNPFTDNGTLNCDPSQVPPGP